MGLLENSPIQNPPTSPAEFERSPTGLQTKDLSGKNFESAKLIIGKVLGSGGFGSVYEVIYSGRRYALKQWHKSSKNIRASNESYEAEISTLNFRHPNIARAYCALELDGFHTLIMEYVGHMNLQELINAQEEPLENYRQVKFALHIARGLAFAHRKGIAHLDLKPSNVLISERDICKIADFGCCQSVGSVERPASPTKSSLTGTFAYLAPELLKGECPTTKADIYSLGICLWQMLTRDRPYAGQNPHVAIFAVVAFGDRPLIPEEKILECKEQCFVDLMRSCWQAEPSSRPCARGLVKILKKWEKHCEPVDELNDFCIRSTLHANDV
ncbi:serine/threonine-protein kinase mos-like [Xenia sp. Carnegie-2017]|uniref:serine/threonine-protein kinase mos-like n=1 Tax=Xenia sp. Carnegie-2017 TaxID=2897299 RepID=UPI001F045CDE|nr:serine/threonine-protein kinase mos-like [Xenia sp. Carnegie-2017]